jgi:hypothetical protein
MLKVDKIERWRVSPLKNPILGSTKEAGNNGCFMGVPIHTVRVFMQISDGGGWEHVSISIPDHKRCPTWEEMCAIKELLWDEEDCVVQYHPPKSQYVSCHPYCLHLWRPTGQVIPQLPSAFVGPDSAKKS